MREWRVPVTTQEPVKTRGRVIPVRNIYRYMAPPTTLELPVPVGTNWRIVNVLVRYLQFGANNQYMTFNLETSMPDASGNVIFGDGISIPNQGSGGVYHGVWTVGGGVFYQTVTIAAVNHYLYHYALPDVWLEGGSVLELAFFNVNANDNVNVWIAYEEENVLG